MESYLILLLLLSSLFVVNCKLSLSGLFKDKVKNGLTPIDNNSQNKQITNTSDFATIIATTNQPSRLGYFARKINNIKEIIKAKSNSGNEIPKNSSDVNNEETTQPTITNQSKFGQLKSKIKRAKDKYKKFKKRLAQLDVSKLKVKNATQILAFFNIFQRIFKKNYTEEERGRRFSIIRKCIKAIKRHNKNREARYKKGINELSDMKWSEIQKQKLGLLVNREKEPEDKNLKSSQKVNMTDIPDSWDWRKYGILTIPRNQGKCGSCWSFATATVLESHNMKRQIAEGKFDPNKQIYVSEQNLIDCSADFGTLGCDGGMPQMAFKYVNSNNGVMSVDDYPYKEEKGNCSYQANKKVDVVVEKGVRLTTGNDEELVRALYIYGPVTSAVHVTDDFTSYKDGIFDDPTCNPKEVNHAVVTVGYTKEYFIVRNSWGPEWGENGYIKISRNQSNNCGISQQGYYPVIPGAVETKKIEKKLVEIKN